MTLFKALDIASTGMTAQRTRMNVAAMNLANKDTTRTAEGGPYKRRDVVLNSVKLDDASSFASSLGRAAGQQHETFGVEVSQIVEDQEAPQLHYDPGHPDANADGYVAMPRVSGIKEMVNLMGAARAYEAGTTIIRTVKQMAEQTLRIGK